MAGDAGTKGETATKPRPLSDAAATVAIWHERGAIRDVLLDHTRSVMSNISASLVIFIILIFCEKPIAEAYNRHLENRRLNRSIASWRSGATEEKVKLSAIAAVDHADIDVAGLAFENERIPETALERLRFWRSGATKTRIANCDLGAGRISHCKFGAAAGGTIIENTYFRSIAFRNVDFSGCRLASSDRGKHVFDSKCTFKNVRFINTEFAGDLPYAEIERCPLWGASFAQGVKLKDGFSNLLSDMGILTGQAGGMRVLTLREISHVRLSSVPIIGKLFRLPPDLQGKHVKWTEFVQYVWRLDRKGWLGV
ncbi:hypothetical protein [Asticcacaulis sp.]|uniref:hypothetical protein n=1 Tax=Asticcacaulis sp. TaxID=1872648 RepID=UPI003F7B752B